MGQRLVTFLWYKAGSLVENVFGKFSGFLANWRKSLKHQFWYSSRHHYSSSHPLYSHWWMPASYNSSNICDMLRGSDTFDSKWLACGFQSLFPLPVIHASAEYNALFLQLHHHVQGEGQHPLLLPPPPGHVTLHGAHVAGARQTQRWVESFCSRKGGWIL